MSDFCFGEEVKDVKDQIWGAWWVEHITGDLSGLPLGVQQTFPLEPFGLHSMMDHLPTIHRFSHRPPSSLVGGRVGRWGEFGRVAPERPEPVDDSVPSP